MGLLTDLADEITGAPRATTTERRELTPAQAAMVQDGLPAAAIISPEDRRIAWQGVKLTASRSINAPRVDEPQPARMATKQQETTVKKPVAKKTVAKKTVARAKATKTTARTPVAPKTPKPGKTTPAAGERPDGLRAGSKQAIMLDMVLNADGATEQAVCAKLGWKKCRVTLKRVCEKVGATLETKKNLKEETVFFATMPKAKAA